MKKLEKDFLNLRLEEIAFFQPKCVLFRESQTSVSFDWFFIIIIIIKWHLRLV